MIFVLLFFCYCGALCSEDTTIEERTLEERDVDVNIGTLHVHLGMGNSIQATSAVGFGCARLFGAGPVCWVATAITAVLSADIEISLGGDTSGSVAHNTKRSQIITKHLYNNTYVDLESVSIPNSVYDVAKTAGLSLSRAFLATYFESNGLVKRAEINQGHVISFTSENGNHIASDVGMRPLEEFVKTIVSSKPVNDTLTKRGWDFTVDWLSYNYDNVNRDLSIKWYEAYESGLGDDKNVIQEEFANYVSRNGAYKYCISAIYSPNEPNQLGKGDTQELQNAFHGELYFNTYGGIDGQCNDNWDCIFGCDGF